MRGAVLEVYDEPAKGIKKECTKRSITFIPPVPGIHF